MDVAARTGLSRRDFVKTAAGAALAVGACGLSGTFAQADEEDDGEAAEAATGETQTVTDMSGVEVEVPVNPTLYADGWYAHNEITIMLTGAEGLVATHCTPEGNPWMYYVCPNMSNAVSTFGSDFNYEELVALGPQVVFDSTDSMRDILDQLGIPLVNCSFSTYEEMQQSIALSAQVFGGDAVEIAERYNDELSQTVADVTAVTDEIAEEDRPTVLHGNSVYTCTLDGTGTIIDTWINAAGGRNAVSDATSDATTQFSLEQIIEWNPDVIITGQPDEVEQILSDPDWASIAAVQNGQVYVNPKGVFGWDRYGVEELLQIQWAAALLHPDLFPDLDIEQKVKDFYSTYLNYELTDEEVKLIMGAQNPPTREDGEESTDEDGSAA